MSVSMIAAIGKNNELGKNNDLIWHFKEDMKFFKETTLGSAVIMGRKTFESLPKALPNRENIVITSNPDFKAQGATVVLSIDEAIKAAQGSEVFIIGGAKIYEQFLPLAKKLYLTEIEAECNEADTFFPHFDKSLYRAQTVAEREENGIKFSHIIYTKI